MSRRKKPSQLQIDEDTRIAINLTIKKLLQTPDQNELEFPSSYTAAEKTYIKDLARQLDLKLKSKGRGAKRCLTVYKKKGSAIIQADSIITLTKQSRQLIINLNKKYPLDSKERQDLLPPTERKRAVETDENNNTKIMGQLNNSTLQVPKLKINYDVLNFRNSLSVMTKRDEILQILASNQVVLIAGETGCGKTTQIPQFILENCQQKNQTCKILCTQPRRLSAVSVAERVAFERGEKIGQTIGYQIRLESKVTSKTLLTYCTNGILLRTLMGNDSALAMITHIIVDEVHERDRFCDFLLIALKDALVKYRSLKVILMSATMDTSIFIKYFNNCSVINVPGKLYNIDVYYLEEVLKITNYETKEMLSKKKELLNNKNDRKVLEACPKDKRWSKFRSGYIRALAEKKGPYWHGTPSAVRLLNVYHFVYRQYGYRFLPADEDLFFFEWMGATSRLYPWLKWKTANIVARSIGSPDLVSCPFDVSDIPPVFEYYFREDRLGFLRTDQSFYEMKLYNQPHDQFVKFSFALYQAKAASLPDPEWEGYMKYNCKDTEEEDETTKSKNASISDDDKFLLNIDHNISIKKELLNNENHRKVLEAWTQYKPQSNGSNKKKEKTPIPVPILKQQNEPVADKVELEPWLVREMDKSITDAWLSGGDDTFTQILHLIHSENVAVDYQHSKTLVTTLMVASGRGYLSTVEQLLHLGANLNLKSWNDWTALDWAKTMNQTECAKLIEAYMKMYDCTEQEDEITISKNASSSEDDKFVLNIDHNISIKKELLNNENHRKVFEAWTQYKPQSNESNKKEEETPIPVPKLKQQNEPVAEKVELEPWLVREMDKCIADAWLSGGDNTFTQILHLIHCENVSVDYQHSKTLVTTLMVASGRGYLSTVEQLLHLGANLNFKSCNDWTALDWAKNMNQIECAKLIEAYMKMYDCTEQEDEITKSKNASSSEDDKFLLNIYHNTFNDENIDYNLLLTLILHIHLKMPMGSILVFLPGYDDIVTMTEKINGENKMNEGSNYILYILHSNMQTTDQKRVFKRSPQGTRKIILSTNIAETSITIDDVVYVIDSGKVKEKSFDAISSVYMLQSNWISQACATQRKGRAGRCQKGICYRLYSSVRYDSMQPYQTPEMLRLPLQQLCLYTKHLAPSNTPIAEFLERAIEPPSNAITRNAVQLLKTVDALDAWEDLTELGSHLLDLPIEPGLGKMLLYAVVLKCLDPILTIVCILASKDPFIMPFQTSEKEAAMLARKELAAGTYSDHMVLLRAFQIWENARANGWERVFCQKNFVSAAVMVMVVGMKTQLLGELRASGFVKARGSGDIRDLNSNSENWAVVKAALTAGLYPNLIHLDRENAQLRTQKEVKVSIHPSSTLRDFLKSLKLSSAQVHAADINSLPCDWMLYEEMSRLRRVCHARTVTVVNPLTVALFSGPARLPMDVIYKTECTSEYESASEVDDSHKGTAILKLDDWMVFKFDAETAELVLNLRQKWNALFLRRMKNPNKAMSHQDEQVIKTLVTVITNEEQAYGLKQPIGIGQRP